MFSSPPVMSMVRVRMLPGADVDLFGVDVFLKSSRMKKTASE